MEIDIKKRYKLITILCSMAITLCLIILVSHNDNTGRLTVNFLDVDQGDAAIIFTPSNERIIIDVGDKGRALDGLSHFIPFYDRTIDYVILTHPDIDHVGSYNQVTQSYKVKNLIISQIADYSNIIDLGLNSFTQDIYKINKILNITIQNKLNEEIHINNWVANNKVGSDNSNSIVTNFTYNNYEFIFTGDLDAENERKYISEQNLSTNNIKILKVGHHGSKTSSSEYFLKSLKPTYCILSYGKGNKYGHPDSEVVERLKKYCKQIYSTAENGNITFKIEGNSISIEKSK